MHQLDQHGTICGSRTAMAMRGDLHGQIIGIAIDDQAAQSVALAEDQPGGPLRVVVAELPAELDGRLEPPPPEGLVQRLGRVPGVEPDPDAAAAVEYAAGDELALVAEQIDDVPVGGGTFDPIDGRVEHPGVPAVEGSGLAGLEDYLVSRCRKAVVPTAAKLALLRTKPSMYAIATIGRQ